MLERRELFGLLMTPAIVRHGSLMKLLLPRWYGVRRFTGDGRIGWYRVSQQVADVFAYSPDWPAFAVRLPRWETCLRSGDPIITEPWFGPEEGTIWFRPAPHVSRLYEDRI
jgi:hypothetical protein